MISSYGTLRDVGESFGAAAPIMKLDLTTLSGGGQYPVTEYVQAYEVEDAQRLGAAAVLTYVQLGAPFELEALRTAASVAARADQAGLAYVCEIMPVMSAAYPDPAAPAAIRRRSQRGRAGRTHGQDVHARLARGDARRGGLRHTGDPGRGRFRA